MLRITPPGHGTGNRPFSLEQYLAGLLTALLIAAAILACLGLFLALKMFKWDIVAFANANKAFVLERVLAHKTFNSAALLAVANAFIFPVATHGWAAFRARAWKPNITLIMSVRRYVALKLLSTTAVYMFALPLTLITAVVFIFSRLRQGRKP